MVLTLVIVAALLAVLGGTAASEQSGSAPKAGDPTGVYLCEGTNPDGDHYRGIVQIAAIKNTYLVRWTLADDVEVMGVGILLNGSLSVSYFGGTPAVVVYKVDPEKLVGQWTMGGAEGKTYEETLTRIPEEKLRQQPGAPGRQQPTSRPTKGGISL